MTHHRLLVPFPHRNVAMSARTARAIPVLLAGLLVFLLVVAVPLSGCRWKNADETVSDAETLLKQKKPADALRKLNDVLAADDPPPKAYLIAARAHAVLGDAEQAAQFYLRVPASAVEFAPAARVEAARLYERNLGELSRAVSAYEAAVTISPSNTAARSGLARLLSVCGRRWEAVPHFLAIIKTGEFSIDELTGLANLGAEWSDPELIEFAAQKAPRDPLVLMAQGVDRSVAFDYEGAKPLFRRAIEQMPTLWEAHARLGLCYVESEAWDQLPAWYGQLPSSHEIAVPNAWLVLARWAEHEGEQRGAARCYAEAIRLDPTNALAHSRLARLLAEQGNRDAAGFLAERARRLVNVQQFSQRIQENPAELIHALPMIQTLEQLGRRWEAWGWARLMAVEQKQRGLPFEPTKQLVQELSRKLPSDSPWVDTQELDSQMAVVADYALPDWEAMKNSRSIATQPQAVRPADIRFEIVGPESGIDFEYYNGAPSPTPAPRLVEVDGGGVGALDYDGDRLPDLWWTQGSHWPPRSDPQYLDRLVRNRGDGTFADVTSPARISEFGFSQGIAVGDFNGDGFDDVVVANIGPNRWFRNQGDGTFEEVTDEVVAGGDRWTSSIVLADLNADGLADCYEVNYLAGTEARERKCPDAQGTPRICPPMMFDPAADRLLINAGDGNWVDASESIEPAGIAGRGLGVATLRDPLDAHRLHLFVANDVTENFLLWQRPADMPGQPMFVDEGLLRGVALDDAGRAQASMGIAAEDFDGDGRLDFFVTNFYNEWNTLYLQVEDGMFRDATRGSGLGNPSLRLLGFGTQAPDLDLDGRPDLVVANGHLVDESRLGIPYRMSAQCFYNVGGGRFLPVPSTELGPYFQQKWLGRSLALLDFDRDGKEDLAVSHLYSPACVLANRSQVAHHWIAFSLAGRESARGASGARVRIRVGDGARMRELVAGSGFQAANERRLVFGVGEATIIQGLTVEWPSGRSLDYGSLKVDREYVAIEGDAQLYELPLDSRK